MEIRRGVVKGFDSQTFQATVQTAGSLSLFLPGLKVARNIPVAEMVTGRSCALLFFDENNPSDAVVIAVYA